MCGGAVPLPGNVRAATVHAAMARFAVWLGGGTSFMER
jgi:hypothetical protein